MSIRSDYFCAKNGCDAFAIWTAALPVRGAVEVTKCLTHVCGRHLAWAVKFLGGPAVVVTEKK